MLQGARTSSKLSLLKKNYYFYFLVHCVFVAACGLSLVVSAAAAKSL